MLKPPIPVTAIVDVPATCGHSKPVGHTSFVAVGGLPDDGQIIGPFANPAQAAKFATLHCAGDYTIEGLRR